MKSSMSKADKYQQQLLEKAQYIYHETPISQATQKACLATPRHLFVKRYREWGIREWREGKYSFLGYTMGIRAFLSISDPSFRPFKIEKATDKSQEYQYFGLWQDENHSLVIAKDDLLIAYGNEDALDRLLQKVKEWVELGMPSAASFSLQVYPIDVPLEVANNQWIVKRKDSQFLWSLKPE
jgi:hypothetical protein